MNLEGFQNILFLIIFLFKFNDNKTGFIKSGKIHTYESNGGRNIRSSPRWP